MPRSPEIPSLWRPLHTPTFRNLLIADVVSDIGAFMQSMGAAWLMVSLNAGPLYVALTQTASALPFFIFALPAGAIGDIVDRRRLILYTETWMTVVALVLAVLTITGFITPLSLLILTFALSAGDAFETPSWRATLPELVAKEELPAASALNGIEFNFARAIGPGLAGLVIITAGVGAAFLLNTVSFIGVIVVVARWKRAVPRRTTPPETVMGATIAAIRYVRYSPAIRTLLTRSGLVMFFASGLLALLPSLAHIVKNSPSAYGLLLGCFGLGAVGGALVMQRARARWSTEAVVGAGVAIFELSTLAASTLRSLLALSAVMVVAGSVWIVFLSLLNVLVLNHTMDRVLSQVNRLQKDHFAVEGSLEKSCLPFARLLFLSGH
jgi:MFS family permease